MKFAHDRVQLLAACQIADAAAADRTTNPILQCLKLVVEADRLVVMGTDNEIGVRYELSTTDVGEPGTLVLPPKQLLDILRQGGTTPIQFTDAKAGEVVKIKTANGKFELTSQDAAKFPDVQPLTGDGPHCQLDAAAFATALRRVKFAVDKSDGTARWATTGIYFELAKDGPLTIAATDTRRLALTTVPLTERHDAMTGLVPMKTVDVLLKTIDAAGADEVQFTLEKNTIRFVVGSVTIESKLVEGKFPPYRDIIPKKPAVSFPIPRTAFGLAVAQAAIMTDVETSRIEIEFAPEGIALSSKAQLGESDVTMELPDGPEKKIEVAFNPKYLLDLLNHPGGETITCEATDGQKPFVFRDGADYLYLVMPLTG